MIILSIKTDQPESEIGLYKNKDCLNLISWQANRQLAETIHSKIAELLSSEAKTMGSIEGIICYGGPGSFTGLRIGMSVANALSYAMGIPIVVCSSSEKWPIESIDRLIDGQNDKIGKICYDSEPFTTLPKK